MNIFQQREKIIEDLIAACKDHDEEKTNHLLNQLTELDKPLLPEEPKERGFYATANDGLLLLKDVDDEWSARACDNSANPIWKGDRQYVKWPTVCETLPPEAFPLKRVNTGDGNDD